MMSLCVYLCSILVTLVIKWSTVTRILPKGTKKAIQCSNEIRKHGWKTVGRGDNYS